VASFHPLLAILDDAQLNAVALKGCRGDGVKHRENSRLKREGGPLWKIPPNFVRELVGFLAHIYHIDIYDFALGNSTLFGKGVKCSSWFTKTSRTCKHNLHGIVV